MYTAELDSLHNALRHRIGVRYDDTAKADVDNLLAVSPGVVHKVN